MYPSYWLQPKLEMRFSTHLVILKVAFCQPKKVGLNEVWVPTLFSSIAFDLQRFLFVFTMKNNAKLIMQKPFDLNPLTKLWKTLSSSQILEHQSPKYIKLIELVVCAIYWFNRGWTIFSTFAFMKTKLKNQLIMHLELIIQMFNQKFFTTENFPFGTTIQSWKDNQICYEKWWKNYWMLQNALCFHDLCLFTYDIHESLSNPILDL